jgi:dUTP pyrophosphatase
MTSSADFARPLPISVQLLREGAKVPYRATEFATGWDLYACLGQDVIEIGQIPVVVPTGIAMAVPAGWDAQVRPRSGLARQGVLSTYGTIDADYRGELMVTMYAVSPDIRHTVRDGDRIAQLVISRHAEIDFQVAAELPPTARGAGGHGSTGS